MKDDPWDRIIKRIDSFGLDKTTFNNCEKNFGKPLPWNLL